MNSFIPNNCNYSIKSHELKDSKEDYSFIEYDNQLSQKEFILNENNCYNPSISHISNASSFKNNNKNNTNTNTNVNMNSYNSNIKVVARRTIKDSNDFCDNTKNSEKGINKFTGSPAYIK